MPYPLGSLLCQEEERDQRSGVGGAGVYVMSSRREEESEFEVVRDGKLI